ncbi:hypothetical protein [Rhodoferax sp.]|uniref:hypothetical protein n=1 Tax=Rhodoferax sp. TaxID=50421 RepID=UPI0025D0FBC1|nr:hypothetical protein [Rhodoferax sp.]MCM2340445.1 hypothetical protein [Rhodoferax sp.]
MPHTIDHMRAALAQAQAQAPDYEQADRTAQVNLLLHLASLKEEHATDADLARTLVDCFDGGKSAYDWVRKARQELGFMLDVLALQVALEGKARAQRQAQQG